MAQKRKYIYLNNAASAWPKAPGVARAVQAAIEDFPEHPGRTVTDSNDILTECRVTLADLLNISDPNQVVLTMNATHALNIVFPGLSSCLKKVITTATEHNSVLRPLYHLKQRNNLSIAIVGLDSNGTLDFEEFEKQLATEPSLVVINHASNVTGRINDVKKFFTKAKEVGAITLLDASQSLGHVTVHPEEMFADLVVFTGHKGLRGPAGTGGLYVSPKINLEQFLVGGTGVRSDLLLHPPDMPMRLESGTPNVPCFSGLLTALKWIEKYGESYYKKEQQHFRKLWDALKEIPKVKIFDDVEGVDRTGVISFCIEGWSVEEIGYVLEESFGIISRTGLHCAPLIHKAIGSLPGGTIRFSVSGFNTEEQIETVISAVKRLAG